MLHIFVVSIHETNDIFFIKLFYHNAFTVVEGIDVRRVFYHQLPFCTATGTQIVGQTFLVILCELVLCIGGKFAIISPLLTFAFIALAY